jgi:prevent-host-death family protein
MRTAMQLNIYDAKAKLSSLLDRALAGETIVIARAGEPVVRLVPVKGVQSKSGVTFGGRLKGRMKLSKDFFKPLTEDELLGK